MALDEVLAAARRSGLRVILSLIDNWKYYNGVDQVRGAEVWGSTGAVLGQ